MNKIIWILIATSLVIPATLQAAEDDLAVIVNKSNATSNLTKSQLRKLVLGEQSSWPGGQKVTVVLRAPGSPEREGVLRAVCRMSEDDYNQHAMHASFSGDSGAPPKILPSAAAVVQLVASTPGAIGFVRVADVKDSVKLLSVDGVAAGDSEYKIKMAK